MKREYSLAYLTVQPMTPGQMVEVAARVGYDYIGVRMTRVTPDEVLHPLSTDRTLRRETKVRLDDTGIRVHDIELLRMDPTRDADHFLPCLEAGADLGARHAICQLPDPDRERAVERFARLCDLAHPLGIFVSLEFPHWTETGTLAEAARVVGTVNRSNAGILVDMLHFGRSDSTLEELEKLPREWFRFAHVCDAAKEVPPTMAGIIRTARDERLFPGEGGIAVREILARMPQRIPYALEIPRATLTKAVGHEEVARLALLVAKSHLEGLDDPIHAPATQPVVAETPAAQRASVPVFQP
jgi:sugar phosphate isomerase/epimerase